MKTLGKSCILFICLLASTVTTFAQNKDYNRVDFVYSHDFTSHHKEWVLDDHPSADLDGVALQYIHGFHLFSKIPLYVEVGGRIGYNWGTIHMNDVGAQFGLPDPYRLDLKATPYLWNLYVPVNIGYRFSFGEHFKIMPYAGLFARYNFYGRNTTRYKVSDGTNVIVDEKQKKNLFGEDNANSGIRRFQIGLNLGANFEYDHVVLGASWGMGFLKHVDHYSYYNVCVNVGYKF